VISAGALPKHIVARLYYAIERTEMDKVAGRRGTADKPLHASCARVPMRRRAVAGGER
jgi:hypothetical protein